MISIPAIPTTESRGRGHSHASDTTIQLHGCTLLVSISRELHYYRYTFDNGTEIIIRTPNPEGTPDKHICTINAAFSTVAEAEHELKQQFAEAAKK